MKLNWAERLVVNNPLRVMEQHFQMKWFKRHPSSAPFGRVLEIGCGRGAGAKLIMEHFGADFVHAMDLDIKMVRMAKSHLMADAFSPYRLYVGDATRLPFKDATMDAVFGFGFLHHVPDWRSALAEVARVLTPGGLYYMEELYPDLYLNVVTSRILAHPKKDRFYSADLTEALEAAGLALSDRIENTHVGILGISEKLG